MFAHNYCCMLMFIFVFHFQIINSDEHNHIYEVGEEVVLWMNTVGPYHNRQETYAYFSLPFCAGDKKEINHYHETLSEGLQGFELKFSGLDVKFKVDVAKSKFCEVELTDEKYVTLVYAVQNHYWYQMYIDDLPIWGVVGELASADQYVWSHKRFEIQYNGRNIVGVNLTQDAKIMLQPKLKLTFTYEVLWRESEIKFAHRFDKYLDSNFFQHRIHWFSIINSFLMVIFLVGVVSMILLRTLRKDYARYSKDDMTDDLDKDLADDYGWKQVHGEVFRAPEYAILFTSLIGTGYHIAFVALFTILTVIAGDLYTERGSVLTTAIFNYVIASPLNGFFGGSLYSQLGGDALTKQVIMSALFLPGCVCGLAFCINLIALYYETSRVIPLISMVAVCAIWMFIILPMSYLGAVLGRRFNGRVQNPCRVSPVPRVIPDNKWFMTPCWIAGFGGILPFGSIFIEMYFIFTSFWAYKIYYVYGFMLLVLIILTIVILCVTVVCTYILLNAEDPRWQWTSFWSGASTAGYVYIYSIYYFFFKTKMYGLFQIVFYFGYMALFSLALGVMCGSIGFVGCSVFVRKIYSTVKID